MFNELALRIGKAQNEIKAGEDMFPAVYGDPKRLKVFVHAMTELSLGVRKGDGREVSVGLITKPSLMLGVRKADCQFRSPLRTSISLEEASTFPW